MRRQSPVFGEPSGAPAPTSHPAGDGVSPQGAAPNYPHAAPGPGRTLQAPPSREGAAGAAGASPSRSLEPVRAGLAPLGYCPTGLRFSSCHSWPGPMLVLQPQPQQPGSASGSRPLRRGGGTLRCLLFPQLGVAHGFHSSWKPGPCLQLTAEKLRKAPAPSAALGTRLEGVSQARLPTRPPLRTQEPVPPVTLLF